MKFPRIHKKASITNKRMLLTEPNSLIGYRIDDGHIKLMSVLGVGGNGVVYLAVECDPIDPINPRKFAVKALSKAGLEPRQLRTIEREFELHSRVSDHPHIVTFHGIIEDADFFFIMLDYIPDGDIFDMIELHRVYMGNDELIKSVFIQLIDAVEHCHRLGISHRDIKPENILCKNSGSHILLADFGLGTDRKVVKEYGFGSEPYMAPQCFGGFWKKLGPYSVPHADIWSLGVVLVNLACMRNPWHKATEESDIYKAFLHDPDYLLEILPISCELNDILKRTFAINPHARISLAELRTKVAAVKSFTISDEELKWASPTVQDAVRRARQAAKEHEELTPGAPHSVAARQITNLTVEDIERLESEAREEAREVSLRTELEARRTTCVEEDEEDDDDTASPLFMSPVIPLSTTVVSQESTPRPPQTTSFDPAPAPIFVVAANSTSSDSDSDSDPESDGPITPESHPAPDIDIADVPEISLDVGGDDVSRPSSADKCETRKVSRDVMYDVSRSATRRARWF